jgi:carboxylate-amine ligase
MDEMQFTRSPEISIGVELELQLVQPHDMDLARDAAALLARLAKTRLPGAVKPEITESMIELNSSVHQGHATLAAELGAMRDTVVREAGMLNLRVSGGGAHPFHSWSDRRIFPTERFKHVLERYGYLAKQFTVFGQHIHVGCPGGDEAVYLVHMMTRYVPHFIALSAASPFYQGEDTSFQSCRLTAVNAFPLAGHMPFVADWGEFVAYFEELRDFGVVESMKDFLPGTSAPSRSTARSRSACATRRSTSPRRRASRPTCRRSRRGCSRSGRARPTRRCTW